MMQRWQEFKCSRIGELLGINTGCEPDEPPADLPIGPAIPPSGIHALDSLIALGLYRRANPRLSWWMRRSTDLASGQVTVPIALSLVAMELRRGRNKSAKAIVITWLGGLMLHVTVKLIYRRKRPKLFPALTQAGGYSLPSGHTVTAVVTYGLVASTVNAYLKPSWRWFPTTTACAIVTAVGTSRAYLGVHYPSDVFAGAAVGLAWLHGSLKAIARIEAEYENGPWRDRGLAVARATHDYLHQRQL